MTNSVAGLLVDSITVSIIVMNNNMDANNRCENVQSAQLSLYGWEMYRAVMALVRFAVKAAAPLNRDVQLPFQWPNRNDSTGVSFSPISQTRPAAAFQQVRSRE